MLDERSPQHGFPVATLTTVCTSHLKTNRHGTLLAARNHKSKEIPDVFPSQFSCRFSTKKTMGGPPTRVVRARCCVRLSIFYSFKYFCETKMNNNNNNNLCKIIALIQYCSAPCSWRRQCGGAVRVPGRQPPKHQQRATATPERRATKPAAVRGTVNTVGKRHQRTRKYASVGHGVGGGAM